MVTLSNRVDKLSLEEEPMKERVTSGWNDLATTATLIRTRDMSRFADVTRSLLEQELSMAGLKIGSKSRKRPCRSCDRRKQCTALTVYVQGHHLQLLDSDAQLAEPRPLPLIDIRPTPHAHRHFGQRRDDRPEYENPGDIAPNDTFKHVRSDDDYSEYQLYKKSATASHHRNTRLR